MAPRQAVTALLLIVAMTMLVVGLTWAQPPNDPEPIDRCQVIDEPGRYQLTDDLEWRFGECLRVHASDVTIDGYGHTISGGRGWLAVVTYGDTTLRDLTIDGAGGGVYARAPTTLERVTISDTALGVRGTGTAGTLTVVDSTFDGGQFAIRHVAGDLTVRGTAFEGVEQAAIYAADGPANVTIEASRFAHGGVGLVTTDDHRGVIAIVETAFVDNRQAIRIDGATASNHRIDEGHFVENDHAIEVAAGTLEVRRTTLRDNVEGGILLDGHDRSGDPALDVGASELLGHDGPAIEVRSGTATIRHSDLRDNDHGLLVDASEADGASTVTIANSTIAGNVHGVERVGDDGVVDARYNYWGAPDGPSSEGYLEDPSTGGFAAGAGDSVSAGADDAANVAFDPFLDAPRGDPSEAPTDAIYNVGVRSIPLTAAPGDEITIVVDVVNTFDLDGDEQVVGLDLGATGSADAQESIALEGGETTSIEFAVALPADASIAAVPIVISTAYDSVELSIHVEAASAATALETPVGDGEVAGSVGIRSVLVALSIALGSMLVVTYLVARRQPPVGPTR